MRRSGLGRPMARRMPRPSQGSAAGSRGQMPSLRPPRMTRSADWTRASSVPQIAMPGWVIDGVLGHVAGGHQRLEERAVVVRRRAAPPASASAASASRRARAWRAGVLLPEGVAGRAGGAGGQRLGGGAVAGDVRGERGRSPAAASGASAARSQAIQAGASPPRRRRPRRRGRPSRSSGAPPRSCRCSRRRGQARGGRARAPGALLTSGCLSRTSSVLGRQRRARRGRRAGAAARPAGSAPAAGRRCRRG